LWAESVLLACSVCASTSAIERWNDAAVFSFKMSMPTHREELPFSAHNLFGSKHAKARKPSLPYAPKLHGGERMTRHYRTRLISATALLGAMASLTCVALSDSLPPDASYRPLPTQPFSVVRAADEAEKPVVMQRQAAVLQQRYDLSNQPTPGVFMSGNRKAVQAGVRVKLPPGSQLGHAREHVA
jgi:hypothetical protein